MIYGFLTMTLFQVFQKRFDGSVDFYKTYEEYEAGFGSLNGEFWKGKHNNKMSKNKKYNTTTNSSCFR